MAKKKLIGKQPPMRNMIRALVPLVPVSVYLFGWRSLVLVLASLATALICEGIFYKTSGTKMTESLYVTALLYGLSLPASVPYWICIAGMAFGIIFGKMVFGGFGKNIFNPALSGRAFVYISFGGPLTGGFPEPFSGLPGGFGAYLGGTDTMTQATPLFTLGEGAPVPFSDLLLGTTRGSIGETCAILILLGGAYLVYKKTASWKIILPSLGGYAILQTVFFAAGLSPLDPIRGLLSGSLLFGCLFMATDPISSSQTTDRGRVFFGLLVGLLYALIRTFSNWPEATTFAILLANMFGPLIDLLIKNRLRAAKEKQR